jgi:hypothetical protein
MSRLSFKRSKGLLVVLSGMIGWDYHRLHFYQFRLKKAQEVIGISKGFGSTLTKDLISYSRQCANKTWLNTWTQFKENANLQPQISGPTSDYIFEIDFIHSCAEGLCLVQVFARDNRHTFKKLRRLIDELPGFDDNAALNDDDDDDDDDIPI